MFNISKYCIWHKCTIPVPLTYFQDMFFFVLVHFSNTWNFLKRLFKFLNILDYLNRRKMEPSYFQNRYSIDLGEFYNFLLFAIFIVNFRSIVLDMCANIILCTRWFTTMYIKFSWKNKQQQFSFIMQMWKNILLKIFWNW